MEKTAFCSGNKHVTFMCDQVEQQYGQQQTTIIIYTYFILTLRQKSRYF